MSWLIEAFLNEEMKTAEDFKKKKEQENKEYNKDALKLYNRSSAREIAKGRTKELTDAQEKVNKGNYDFKKALDDEKKNGYLYNSVDKAAAHKYGKNWKSEFSKAGDAAMKKGPESMDEKTRKRMIDMGSDVERAQDAAERHNRRHPESKLETADIIEILQ